MLRLLAVGTAATLGLAACGSPSTPEQAVSAGAANGSDQGNGQDHGTKRARELCELHGRSVAEQNGLVNSLNRVELSTAGEVAEWQENRFGPDGPSAPSPLRNAPASAEQAICIFHGEFNTRTGPPPIEVDQDDKVKKSGAVAPKHNRLRVIVGAEGTAFVDAAGYEDSQGNKGGLKPETPEDFRKDGPNEPTKG